MASIKVSIKSHNLSYLQLISEQMQVSNLSEVINYLLLELKKQGYSYGSPLPQLSNLQQQELGFKIISESKPLLPDSELPEEVQEQIDPVIERLVELGVCNQF
jgi:hypothetical protein